MSAENQNDAPRGQQRPLASKLVHLQYLRHGANARCGRETKHVTTDERLVTCALGRYWAHRGYTAPDVPRETTG
jgi:hypothetical protein